MSKIQEMHKITIAISFQTTLSDLNICFYKIIGHIIIQLIHLISYSWIAYTIAQHSADKKYSPLRQCPLLTALEVVC